MRPPRGDPSWTPARGLRRLALSLGIRSGIVVVAWSALMCLAFTDEAGLVFRNQMGLLVGLLAGIPLGAVLSYRLTDHAGFTGPVVAIAALALGVAAGVVGSLLAGAMTTSGDVTDYVMFPSGAFGGAAGVILRLTLVES